jgi:putative mRNA 3-end processing factor
LITTIKASGARKILATHGNTNALVRYLKEQECLDAEPLETGTLYGNEETG